MKKLFVTLLMFILVSAVYCPDGWSQPISSSEKDDELNLLDLLIARPAGFAAGIVGTGIFVVTLPFTIPAGGVQKASKMLITDPFRFSLSRPFPDENEKFY